MRGITPLPRLWAPGRGPAAQQQAAGHVWTSMLILTPIDFPRDIHGFEVRTSTNYGFIISRRRQDDSANYLYLIDTLQSG